MDFYAEIERISKTRPVPEALTEMVEEYEAVVESIEENERDQENLNPASKEYRELQDEIAELEDEMEGWEQKINLYVTQWGGLAAHTNPSTQPQAQPKAPAKETSGGGFGWALFGVLALVVTFGAVNTFNK